MANTDNMRGTNVALVSWVTSVIMFFAVAIKLGTRMLVTKSFGCSIDGALILAAMAFALGQTGAISYAVESGFGMHLSTLTSVQIASYQQSIYAADILFITTICLTKLSVVAFFLQSTIGTSPRAVGGALVCFILTWFIISIFGLAFQCSLPHPWMFIQNTCMDLTAFWYFIVIVDVIIDICILVLPFYTIQFLHLTSAMRHKIITPFFGRIILIPLAILRLYYLTRELNAPDSSYNLTTSMLLEVIHMNVAIIVSCIPFSRLLIMSVSSGLWTTNIRTHAPNFDGVAEFNLSNIEQRYSQGALKSPTSGLSRDSKMSRNSKWLGSISLSDDTSWYVPWKNVKYTARCSVRDANGGSGIDSTTTSELRTIRATTEWAVDRASLPDE